MEFLGSGTGSRCTVAWRQSDPLAKRWWKSAGGRGVWNNWKHARNGRKVARMARERRFLAAVLGTPSHDVQQAAGVQQRCAWLSLASRQPARHQGSQARANCVQLVTLPAAKTGWKCRTFAMHNSIVACRNVSNDAACMICGWRSRDFPVPMCKFDLAPIFGAVLGPRSVSFRRWGKAGLARGQCSPEPP